MNGTTGYAGKTTRELLDMIEHQDYKASEAFWLAKELEQRFQASSPRGVINWNKEEKKWEINHD